MKKGMTINADSFRHIGQSLGRGLNKYRVVIVFVVLALLYLFIIWRINVLVVAAPSEEEVKTAESGQTMVRIDETVVQKMMNLKDNSVRVQTLFEDARNNPFSE